MVFCHKEKLIFAVDQIIMGGVEKVAKTLLPMLTKKYDVTVLVHQKITDEYFLTFFKQNNITVLNPFSDKPKTFWKRKIWKMITRRIEKYKLKRLLKSADIFLDYKNFYWADYIKNIHAKKIVVFHGSFVLFQKWQCIKKLPTYDRFVCLTDNFKNDFINNYPEHKNKIEHIYNPLDTNEICQNAQDRSLVPNEKYFVAVQRLDKIEKDVVTIIRAFDIFCKNHPDVYLYIVGNGPDKESLQTTAKNNPNIIFTGQVNNPYSLIQNAQALILSSIKDWGEGLPTVPLEAQALGTLAISSNVPSGPSEILMNGKAGILFEPHNEKELANVMTNVITNKITKNDLINCATKNLNRFDTSVILEKFLSIMQIN